MLEIEISKTSGAIGVLLSVLLNSRREQIYVGDIYADGYIVQTEWQLPIVTAETIGGAVGGVLAIVIVAIGVAALVSLASSKAKKTYRKRTAA